MTSNEELREVLRVLLERSRMDEVHWQLEVDSLGNDDYSVALPQSTMTIQRCEPTADPDFYRVRIVNRQGREVLSTEASVEAETPDEKAWLELLRDLYDDARRCANGWDLVLQDLRSAVQSDHPVGIVKGDSPF